MRSAAGIAMVALMAAGLLGGPSVAQSSPEKSSAQAAPEHGASREPAKTSNEAAGGEGEEHDPNAQFRESPSVKFMARHLGISMGAAYWASVLLNFLIIAGAIAVFMKMKLPQAFRSRTESMQKAMEEARLASEAANRRLAEIESKLAQLGAEISGWQAAAAGQAEEEEARARAAGEEEKQKIVRAAEQEIVAAANSARRDLKGLAAKLAVELAEKKIKIDADTDSALVRDFLDQLGRNGK